MSSQSFEIPLTDLSDGSGNTAYVSEDDFKYILSRPRLYSATWALADTPGKFFESIPLSKSSFSASTLRVMDHFHMYRCDFDVCVEVVCSAFHRGKLLISHTMPGVTVPTTTAAALNQASEILDLAEKHSSSFRIPWQHRRPYIVDNPMVGISTPETNGYLNVSLYENLSTSGTYTDGVTILVYLAPSPSLQMRQVIKPGVCLKSEIEEGDDTTTPESRTLEEGKHVVE
jgi:hypothetical protein